MSNSSLSQHPYGIRYYLLWLGAWTIRLPAILGIWISERKSLQTLPSDVTRTRITIPSRDKGRGILVDVYSKKDQLSTATKKHVHINFHGSGFVIPSLGADIDFCAQLASTGTTVFDADYRKAPEHPFPAAHQDSQDVLAYIQSHPSDFDTNHITTGGFSAGANLAMSLAVNTPPNTIKALISFYGNTDITKSHPAPNPKTYNNGIILPDWLRTFFYNCLVLPNQDRSDTRLSPAYASLDRWPKHVLFVCGTADSLHEPERIMADRLKNENGTNDVDFISVENEAHAFDKNVQRGSVTESRREMVYKRALEVIERAQKD